MKTFWQIEHEVRAAAIRSGQQVLLVPWGPQGVKRVYVTPAMVDKFPDMIGLYDQNFAPNAVIEDLIEHFGQECEVKFGASRINRYQPKEKGDGQAVLQAA
jgi:hypothetical protein